MILDFLTRYDYVWFWVFLHVLLLYVLVLYSSSQWFIKQQYLHSLLFWFLIPCSFLIAHPNDLFLFPYVQFSSIFIIVFRTFGLRGVNFCANSFVKFSQLTWKSRTFVTLENNSGNEWMSSSFAESIWANMLISFVIHACDASVSSFHFGILNL